MIEFLVPERLKFVGTYTTPNPIHKHVKWELIIIEEGSIINHVNGVPYKAPAGSVTLLGPCHTHAIEVTSPTHRHRDVYLEQSLLASALENFSSELMNDVLSGKLLINLSLDMAHLTSIIKTISKLERLCLIESISKNNTNVKNFNAITLSILQYVLGIYSADTYLKQTTYPEWFTTFLYRLNKSEIFTKNVSEIISETNYSHTQLGKLFKKYCGVTLVDYLKSKRLSYACELLNNTDHTALFICGACGYDSYSYFERTFKEKFGCTPNQYKKRNQPTPK